MLVDWISLGVGFWTDGDRWGAKGKGPASREGAPCDSFAGTHRCIPFPLRRLERQQQQQQQAAAVENGCGVMSTIPNQIKLNQNSNYYEKCLKQKTLRG